jgi:Raf kinase inhibitor-like YbhB/YbcL family protein
MRRFAIAVAAALSVFGAGVANAAGFSLSSSDIKAGGTIAEEQVFKGFGCSGGNVSPALAWKGAPKATKSFALSIYDPDAPTGSGFWHWVVFNIPAGTTSIAKGASKTSMPAGAIESRTDFGVPGYGGPCPPQGDKPHHYHFQLFAVDVPTLEGADANTTAAVIGFMLHFHTIAKTQFVATYGRK